jgi:hypothetical protein
MGNVPLDLKKHYPGAEALAKLQPKELRFMRQMNCSPSSPCGSFSCAACGKAVCKWLKGAAKTIFSNGSGDALQTVTIIIDDLVFDRAQLGKIDIRKCARRFRDLISQAGLSGRIWIGAIDVSLNVRRKPKLSRRWCVHAMIITKALSEKEKVKLKSYLRVVPELDINRPLKTCDVYNLSGAFDYGFKATFEELERYKNYEGKPRVRHFPLKGSAQTALLEAMQGVPHTDRLITIGCRRQGQIIRLG